MKTSALLLASSILLVPVLDAQGKKERRRVAREARKFRQLKVPGEQVAQNVARLTSEMRWHKSLRSLLTDARSKKRPAVWIQALGDLEGFL